MSEISGHADHEVIDVHCHVATPSFPLLPEGSVNPRWPCTRCVGDKVDLVIDGRLFRRLDDRSWNLDRRLADMAQEGVTRQVLSPMPELLSYWFSSDDAVRMCEHVNGAIAEHVARRPDAFSGFGMVPMQDPQCAAAMVGTLNARFGLAGIEVGSNVNGAYLGDPRFDIVWGAAEAAGMAVFVHALHPRATSGIAEAPLFDQLAGFAADVGLSAASVIMNGVLSRFPHLRVGFSHGGGGLSAALGRLDMGWGVSDAFRQRCDRAPSEISRSMFFDSNIYDPRLLRHLARAVSPGRVFLGTDYPYASMQTEVRSYIDSVELNAGERRSIMAEAAKRFAGLT